MKKPKVVLVSINPEIKPYCAQSRTENIGLGYLGAILQDKYHVKIYQDSAENLEKLIFQEKEIDVVGFSSMTWNWPLSVNLAKKIKKEYSAKTIAGGYHPTSDPLNATKDFDAIVVGEGEQTIQELIPALLQNENLKNINGIVYIDMKTKQPTITTPRQQIIDLDSVPFPMRDNEILQSGKLFQLIYPSINNQKGQALITYSRGCPHACTFCCSEKMWNKTLRFRDPKEVAREIQEIKSKYEVDSFVFTDLTFNQNFQKATQLCNEINDLGVYWYTMCSYTTNPELYKKMAEAGCTKIGFGIESANLRTREMIGKDRLTNELVIQNLQKAWNAGIIIKMYAMVGYPWETKTELLENLELLKKFPIDDMSITFVTPFPGTKIYNQYETSITTKDFSKYDVDHPIFKPNHMEPEELLDIRRKFVRDFYTCKDYHKRAELKMKLFPHLTKSYNDFFIYLKENDVI